MKELTSKQITSLEGGWTFTIEQGCEAFAVAVALDNGVTAGGSTWFIITGMAYNSCINSYLQ